MRDFAELACSSLRDSGYSMSAAARAINYDLSYVSRVLNGKQDPSPRLAKALDDLIGADGALSALVLNEDDKSRVSRSVENPSRLDSATVSALSGVLVAYRRLDDSVSPEIVIPGVFSQMREVTRVLREARGPHRDELAEVASEYLQFSGWMLAQVQRNREAVELLSDALDLADEIGNGTLAAQALNFKGHIARQQKRPTAVVRWYSAAADTPGAHPAQRLGDILHAATGLADLGKRSEALLLMEKAERVADEAAALAPPKTAYWRTPAFNRLNLGLCTLALGRYGEAVDHLSSGLEELPAEFQYFRWSESYRDALREAKEAL